MTTKRFNPLRPLLVIAACTIILIAGAALHYHEHQPKPLPTNYLGDSVTNVTLTSGLTIHVNAGCNWSVPGANPWQGDTESALRLMHVDDRAAAIIADRIKAKRSDSSIEIKRGSIGPYIPVMVGTFGNTVCYGTEVRFNVPQHALVYTYQGYTIIVPDICGNVARVWRKDEVILPPDLPLLFPPMVGGHFNGGYAGPGSGLYYGPGGPLRHGSGPDMGIGVNGRMDVPEPRTWALMGIGVVGLMFVRRKT